MSQPGCRSEQEGDGGREVDGMEGGRWGEEERRQQGVMFREIEAFKRRTYKTGRRTGKARTEEGKEMVVVKERMVER